jgi:pyrroline-5-carboxylate reductase
MKVGFIGYGSMGSMLLKQFILTGALKPEEIIVFNRTAAKLHRLQESFPSVEIAKDIKELASKARYIFLCTKALDMLTVLEELKGSLAPDTHIISIAGAIKASDISKCANRTVSKLIPTVTSEVLEGVSLLYHEPSVSKEDASFIENLLGKIGSVKLLKEDEFALITEVTSCGPGLIAGIFKEMLDAAARHSDLYSREELQELLINTLYGTAKLFIEEGLSFDETISRVATKGGITEEGILVGKKHLPGVFDEMFDQMLRKRKAAQKKVEDALSGKNA